MNCGTSTAAQQHRKLQFGMLHSLVDYACNMYLAVLSAQLLASYASNMGDGACHNAGGPGHLHPGL
jgi:hypothetical protein